MLKRRLNHPHRPAPPRLQRGLSIVEAMVGITIGLFVIAGATMVVAGQLSSNRRLLLDTQIQQDLRISADIIARELRRAGALRDTAAARTLWVPGSTSTSPNGAVLLAPATAAAHQVDYSYERGAGIVAYGFKLVSGRIQSKFHLDWQDLTDPQSMYVDDFTVTPITVSTTTIPCPTLCMPAGDTACWPTVTVRQLQFDIKAHAANDPSVTRSVRGLVTVRNDAVAATPVDPSGFCR